MKTSLHLHLKGAEVRIKESHFNPRFKSQFTNPTTVKSTTYEVMKFLCSSIGCGYVLVDLFAFRLCALLAEMAAMSEAGETFRGKAQNDAILEFMIHSGKIRNL